MHANGPANESLRQSQNRSAMPPYKIFKYVVIGPGRRRRNTDDAQPQRQRKTMSMSMNLRPEWDVILIACKDGDPVKVQRLLESGIPPYHANAVGQSAIHVAAWWGWSDVLKVLCRACDDDNSNTNTEKKKKKKHDVVNAQNTIAGSTPLHCLVNSIKSQGRRVDAARVLLENGADVSIVDYSQYTPIDFLTSSDKYDGTDVERKELIQLFTQFASKNSPPDTLQRMLLDCTVSLTDIEKHFEESILTPSGSVNNDEGSTQNLLLEYSRQGDTPLLALVREWVERQHTGGQDGGTKEMSSNDFFDSRIEWVLSKLGKLSHCSSAGGDNGDKDGLLSRRIVDMPRCPPSTGNNTSYGLLGSSVSLSSTTNITKEPNALDLLCQGIFDLYKDLSHTSAGAANTSIVSLLDLSNNDCAFDTTASTSGMINGCDRITLKHWSKLALKLVHEYGSKPCADTTSQTWFDIARRNYRDLASFWWGPPAACHQQQRHLNISPLNVINRQGMSPLHFAARSGHLDMVKWLVETEQMWIPHGLSIQDNGGDGREEPTLPSQPSSSSWLLHHKDQYGKTALDAAKANGKESIVGMLDQLMMNE